MLLRLKLATVGFVSHFDEEDQELSKDSEVQEEEEDEEDSEEEMPGDESDVSDSYREEEIRYPGEFFC